MQIYYEKEEELKQISIPELDRLGKELEKFIKEYEQRILMDEEDKKNINALKMISTYINCHQYHMLITDTNLIKQIEDDVCPF